MELSRKDMVLIRTALRKSFIQSEYRYSFLKSHRIEVPKYKKNGELAKRPFVRYPCKNCRELYPGDGINVDHVKKVGTFVSVMDIENFFFRIWCCWDNLQLLCFDCHKLKTASERKLDAASKKYL